MLNTRTAETTELPPAQAEATQGAILYALVNSRQWESTAQGSAQSTHSAVTPSQVFVTHLCEPHTNSVLPPVDFDKAPRITATLDAFSQRTGASAEVSDPCAMSSIEVGMYCSDAEVSSLKTKFFQPEQEPYTAGFAEEPTSSS